MNVDVFTVRSVAPGYMYFAICVEDQDLMGTPLFYDNPNEHELVFVNQGYETGSTDLYFYSFLTFRRNQWFSGAASLRGTYKVSDTNIVTRSVERESLDNIERYAFIGPIHPAALNSCFNGDIQQSPMTGKRILEKFEEDGFETWGGQVIFRSPDALDDD